MASETNFQVSIPLDDKWSGKDRAFSRRTLPNWCVALEIVRRICLSWPIVVSISISIGNFCIINRSVAEASCTVHSCVWFGPMRLIMPRFVRAHGSHCSLLLVPLHCAVWPDIDSLYISSLTCGSILGIDRCEGSLAMSPHCPTLTNCLRVGF